MTENVITTYHSFSEYCQTAILHTLTLHKKEGKRIKEATPKERLVVQR